LFSISWNSSGDEMNEYNDYQFEDDESTTVASRTRSHTPPNHHTEKKQVLLFFFFKFFFTYFGFCLEKFSQWKKIK
jgi:hypothetical protein